MVTTSALPLVPTPGHGHGHGYWCEATAITAVPGHAIPLSTHQARSPRLALRWLRARVQDVTEQLDPPYAAPAHHWLTDEPEHDRARTLLAHGGTYTLTLHDESARFILSARPTGNTR
ncbi:hypothetical protein ACIBCM_33250 [Streptomyces sp. NPDC051018]|uniref:hypothetical protein n=1 Tax=Streptomyces sp. NPDC051018 TaxID=3365639 RepID=UPI0037B4BE32